MLSLIAIHMTVLSEIVLFVSEIFKICDIVSHNVECSEVIEIATINFHLKLVLIFIVMVHYQIIESELKYFNIYKLIFLVIICLSSSSSIASCRTPLFIGY